MTSLPTPTLIRISAVIEMATKELHMTGVLRTELHDIIMGQAAVKGSGNFDHPGFFKRILKSNTILLVFVNR